MGDAEGHDDLDPLDSDWANDTDAIGKKTTTTDERLIIEQLHHTLRALWKTGIELFIHQILYRRSVYPSDSFCAARFVGAACKINRNHGVLVYIAEALEFVMPTLFGPENCSQSDLCGVWSQELLVQIYDPSKGITYEEFSLCFSLSCLRDEDEIHSKSTSLGPSFSFPTDFPSGKIDELSSEIISELERDLRDLVCSTGKLEGLPFRDWDDTISFRILLVVDPPKATDTSDERRASFRAALEKSKWCAAKRIETVPISQSRVVHSLSNADCQFQCRIVPRLNKSIRGKG